MFTLNRKSKVSFTAAAAATVLGQLASSGIAQASVNVQSYNSAANSTYTLTEDAMLEVAPKDPTWNGSRLFFSANYNWVNDPLVEYNADRLGKSSAVVDGIQTLDMTVGWFVARRVSIDFSAPLNLVHLPNQASQFGLGDSRAFAKVRLTGDDAIVAVSLMPELRLPTGDGSMFLSDGSLGLGLGLAFEHDFGPIRASANIGYRYSPEARYLDLNYTQRLPMALGLFAPIGPRWGINAEAAGAMVLPRDRYNNPGEIYAGARYQFHRDAAVLGGASIGSVSGLGGNDVRVSIGIRFSPMPEGRQIYAAAPAPAPAPLPVVKAPAPIKRVIFTAKEIKISEEVKFLHASAILTKSGKNLLDEVAQVMKKNRKGYHKIMIEGHTNELGSYPYNQSLSEMRAASVREYLASRGISNKELFSIGYGKTKPKYLAGLSKGAQLEANRRVEFKVIN